MRYVFLCVTGIAVFVATIGLAHWIIESRQRAQEATAQARVASNAEAIRIERPEIMAQAEARMDQILEKSEKDRPTAPVKTTSNPKSDEPSIPDAEWKSFPRLKFGVANYLTGPPKSIKLSRLFRHVELNPRDVFVSKPHRKALEASLARFTQRIEEELTVESGAAAREFEALRKSGRARTKSVAQVVASLSADEKRRLEKMRIRVAEIQRENGVKPNTDNLVMPNLFFKGGKRPYAFKATDGVVSFATLAELPATKKAVELRVFMTTEFVQSMLAWFGRHAGLSQPEQSNIMLKTYSAQEKMIR